MDPAEDNAATIASGWEGLTTLLLPCTGCSACRLTGLEVFAQLDGTENHLLLHIWCKLFTAWGQK